MRGASTVRVGLATVVAGAALAAPAKAVVPAGDLVVNGGAEIGPSSGEAKREPIAGWTTTPGATGFEAIDYLPAGDPGTLMHVNDVGVTGCRGFFGGFGATTATSATQTVDVSAAAAEIDSGAVTIKVTAALGGLGGTTNTTEMRVNYVDAAGTATPALFLGTVPPLVNRVGATSVSAPLVPGVRKVELVVTANYTAGSSNTGYADNVGLTLDGSDPTVPPEPGCDPPSATTAGASEVTATGATLAGTVATGLDPAEVRFAFGETPALGERLSAGGVPVGSDQLVQAALADLRPGTTYHYRIEAENPYGAPQGETLTFTTAAASRKLSIKYKRGKFKGKVKSNAAACRAGKVTVLEAAKGKDPKVAKAKAKANGKWSVRESVDQGKYYAKVKASRDCPAAKSKQTRAG